MNAKPALIADDLLAAAATCCAALEPVLDRDWEVRAGDLEWSCRRTLDHIADALLLYTTHLATRATARRPPPRNGDPSASPAELLSAVESIAATNAEVIRAAPPGTRAFHPAGMADTAGFIGMGCEEILVHTWDIAGGLGVPFAPSADLAARIVARIFPWAPADVPPWDALRWGAGRIALPGHDRLGPDWYWHCAPLEEWDGTIRKRTAPPAWR
ncbi:MAG: hypothetical protein QOF01_1911 [Thermomicrobiales bacterium]|jgi:hypothetical protein|nr:hypothetical protein [Thermomicrobiales bacterium]